MGSVNYIKLFVRCTLLSIHMAITEKNFSLWSSDSNPGQQDEKRKRHFCAMPTPHLQNHCLVIEALLVIRK